MADILERGIKLGVDASPTKRGFAQIETAVNSLIKSMNTLDSSLSKVSAKQQSQASASKKAASEAKKLHMQIKRNEALKWQEFLDRDNAALKMQAAEAKKAAAAQERLRKAQQRSIDTTKKQTSAFNSAHKSIIQLRSVATSLGIIFSAQSLINTIDNYTLLNARLKLVTNSTEELAIAQKDVVSIANNTRASLVDTVQLYTRISRALKGTQTSMADVATITSTVSKALVISGANAGEARASMLQLSQAFNKGKLDGDEFRTVMELMPPVAQAIAEEMGVTRGALLELAPQGKITAEIMSKAMVNASEEISEAFKDVPVTIGQAITVLGNKFTMVGGQFLSGPGKIIVSVIQSLAENMDILVTAVSLVALTFTGKFANSLLVSAAASTKKTTAIRVLNIELWRLSKAEASATATTTAMSSAIARAGIAARVAGVAMKGFYASLGLLGTVAVVASTAMMFFTDNQEENETVTKRLNAVREEEAEHMKTLTGLTEKNSSVAIANAKAKVAQAAAELKAANARVAAAKATLQASIAEAVADGEDADTRGLVAMQKAFAGLVSDSRDLSKALDESLERLKDFEDRADDIAKGSATEFSKKVKKVTSALEAEIKLIGANETQLKIYNSLRSAGIDIMNVQISKTGEIISGASAEAEAIAKLGRAYLEKKEAQDAADARTDFFKSQDKSRKNSEQQAELDVIRVTQGELAYQKQLLINQNKEKELGLTEEQITAQAEANTKSQELVETSKLQVDLANKIDSGFESALDGIIKGTQSAGDAFKSLAVDIAAAIVKAQILRAITNATGGGSAGGLISGLFSGLAFASGGRPPTGQASVVGEKGPELFVPDSAGTIISNKDLATGGGGTYVSVSNPVCVQIVNQGTPQETQSQEQSTGPDGRTIIKLLVNDAVQQGINNGSFDATMATNYGVRRRGS